MTEKLLSRRRVLKALGGTVVGAAAGLPLAAQVASSSEPTKTKAKAARQWAMVIDLRKCEGCVTRGAAPACIEACNLAHFVPEGQEWIRVLEQELEFGGTAFLPVPCMQCENAPCVNVCPVGASYHSDEGIVLVDHEKCIGCRLCMAACPYGARSFNWGQPDNPPGATFASYSPEYPIPHRVGTVEKCMLCAHEVQDGKLPACVSGCPMNALYLGDMVSDVATNGVDVVPLRAFLADNSAYRLKEELGTRPRVWYIPGHGQEYDHTTADDAELEPARSWQEQEADA